MIRDISKCDKSYTSYINTHINIIYFKLLLMYIYVKIPDEEITFREENSDIDEIKVLKIHF